MAPFPIWTRQRRPSKVQPFILPVISIFFFGYFGFHAFHGEYGLKSRYKLESKIEELQGKLQEIKNRRKKLEQKVLLLQDGSIEKDMLEEQAHKVLGVLGMNEVRIMLPIVKKSEKNESFKNFE